MAGLSPTQRTLAAMREQGRICGIVEKFQQYGGSFGVRQDLFGFIDIIAIDPTDGIIAIQSCGQSWSSHIKKLTDERSQPMEAWLRHAPLELWGWRKVKNRLKGGGYGKGFRWKPRIADFYLDENGVIICKERA